MRTYVYSPQSPNGQPRRDSGLVLYSEIFQQTAPVRRLAVQFASLGYLVMVPEVYHCSEPPGTVLGQIRITEQGEVIASKYADPDIGRRNLETLVAATLEATLLNRGGARPDESIYREVMEEMS